MLELPESNVLAKQANDILKGKIISFVKAGDSPHKFAWYYGNKDDYDEMLSGKTITGARACGGIFVLEIEDCIIAFSDGASPIYYEDPGKAPERNQLWIEFDDETVLCSTVQMYGGMMAAYDGKMENPYFEVASERPSPLSDEFTFEYFHNIAQGNPERTSAKAFLATEQRIPGLGNGVLQDILLEARVHPKTKMAKLTEDEWHQLYDAVKKVLKEMVTMGGRSTEKTLTGEYGGYEPYLSKKTLWTPCPFCGNEIHKSSFMGGTIYYCDQCQKEK